MPNKISRSIAILYKVKSNLNIRYIDLLNNALYVSHYASLLLIFAEIPLNRKLKKSLQIPNLQKMAIKYISN